MAHRYSRLKNWHVVCKRLATPALHDVVRSQKVLTRLPCGKPRR